ncbi:MAG: hypothetical protein WC509_02895 [Candidatus Izemoplasmatales bacterium]
MAKFKSNEDYFAYSKTLSVIPAEDLAALLMAHKIRVPFYVHRFVLKDTIYPKVFQTQLYQTYTDEVKYRLRGYHEYSLYLLEKLIEDYGLDFDAARYKEIFFDLLFLNRELYGIRDAFLNDLDKLKYKYAVDFEKIGYRDFIAKFGVLFYEPAGYLDGVNLGILKDVLVHSCTLGDLRGIGEKYGVKIPRRINKFQLVDILAKRFRLSQAEIDLINGKSVLELEIYAKEKGFSISIDLKKSDMVEFLVFSLNLYHVEVARDAHNYQVPLSADIDAVVIDGIDFVQNDQDIPVEGYVAPVKSEPKPEAAPEPKPEPAVVQEEEVEAPAPMRQPEPAPAEEKKPEPVAEAKPAPGPVPEPEPAPKPVPEPEPAPKPEPEPVREEPKPEPEPVREEPKPEPAKEPEPARKPVPLSGPEAYDFSDEERGLLDEKINQIIRKYNKRRRQKTFWIVFASVLGAAILGFAGYVALYYYAIDPGNLPPFLQSLF